MVGPDLTENFHTLLISLFKKTSLGAEEQIVGVVFFGVVATIVVLVKSVEIPVIKVDLVLVASIASNL